MLARSPRDTQGNLRMKNEPCVKVHHTPNPSSKTLLNLKPKAKPSSNGRKLSYKTAYARLRNREIRKQGPYDNLVEFEFEPQSVQVPHAKPVLNLKPQAKPSSNGRTLSCKTAYSRLRNREVTKQGPYDNLVELEFEPRSVQVPP